MLCGARGKGKLNESGMEGSRKVPERKGTMDGLGGGIFRRVKGHHRGPGEQLTLGNRHADGWGWGVGGCRGTLGSIRDHVGSTGMACGCCRVSEGLGQGTGGLNPALAVV